MELAKRQTKINNLLQFYGGDLDNYFYTLFHNLPSDHNQKIQEREKISQEGRGVITYNFDKHNQLEASIEKGLEREGKSFLERTALIIANDNVEEVRENYFSMINSLLDRDMKIPTTLFLNIILDMYGKLSISGANSGQILTRNLMEYSTNKGMEPKEIPAYMTGLYGFRRDFNQYPKLLRRITDPEGPQYKTFGTHFSEIARDLP